MQIHPYCVYMKNEQFGTLSHKMVVRAKHYIHVVKQLWK